MFTRFSPLFLCIFFSLAAAARGDASPRLTVNALPALPSAAHGMALGGGDRILLAAGGVRQSPALTGFADLQAESTMFRLRENAGSWERFETGDARAFAASVLHGGSLYAVGGISREGLLSSVVRYEIRDDQAVTHALASLPQPLALARAVVFNGTLWVFGGVTSLDPPVLNDQIFRLPLSGPAAAWSAEPAPFAGRILPVASVQLQSVFVGGGWSPGESGEGWVAQADFWRYRTEGSLSNNPWRQIVSAPAPLGDAEVFTVGQSHLMLVNIPEQTRVPALEDLFSGERRNLPVVTSYHAITDIWYALADWPAGAGRVLASGWEVADRTGFQVLRRRVPVMLTIEAEAPDLAKAAELRVHFPKGRLHLLDYLLMILYVAVMVWLGVYYAKKEKNSEDFFVGGRRIPWWAAAISAQATGASAITMMAIPALVYKESIVYFGGLFLGIIPAALSAVYLVPILRKLNVVSVYEYLEHRFGNSVRLLGAGVYVLSQVVGRMGVVVMLPAMALSAVTGINVYACILVTGLVAMFYTTLGGISSVIWSDVIQFLIMLGGVFLCVGLILAKVEGGFQEFIAVSTDYDKWRLYNFTFDFTLPVFWVMLLMAPLGAFAGISDQAFVQRIASVKDVKGAQKATVWNYLWALPLQTGMWVVGIALFVFFRHYPEALDPTLGTDTVFPQFISRKLPAGLSGLMIIGILAAAMSSLDSAMNSVSTVIVTDFYRLFNKTATEKSCLRLARAMTMLTGLLGIASAIFITRLDLASGQEAFARIMGLITGGFPGLFMLALLTRRGNSAGAFAGVIGASLAVFLVQKYTPVNWTLYSAIAFITSISVGYLVSCLTGGSRKDVADLTVWALKPPAESGKG